MGEYCVNCGIYPAKFIEPPKPLPKPGQFIPPPVYEPSGKRIKIG